MVAILYETRDWGFVEVKKIENAPNTMILVVPVPIVPSVANLLPRFEIYFRDETFLRIGKLPSGDIMYVKQLNPNFIKLNGLF